MHTNKIIRSTLFAVALIVPTAAMPVALESVVAGGALLLSGIAWFNSRIAKNNAAQAATQFKTVSQQATPKNAIAPQAENRKLIDALVQEEVTKKVAALSKELQETQARTIQDLTARLEQLKQQKTTDIEQRITAIVQELHQSFGTEKEKAFTQARGLFQDHASKITEAVKVQIDTFKEGRLQQVVQAAEAECKKQQETANETFALKTEISPLAQRLATLENAQKTSVCTQELATMAQSLKTEYAQAITHALAPIATQIKNIEAAQGSFATKEELSTLNTRSTQEVGKITTLLTSITQSMAELKQAQAQLATKDELARTVLDIKTWATDSFAPKTMLNDLQGLAGQLRTLQDAFQNHKFNRSGRKVDTGTPNVLPRTGGNITVASRRSSGRQNATYSQVAQTQPASTTSSSSTSSTSSADSAPKKDDQQG